MTEEFTERTPKQLAVKAIQSLPDNCTLEDMIETLCFIHHVGEGLRDAEAGRVVSGEEVMREFGI